MKYIASLSGGKDSTAMVLNLLEKNYPLDEIIYCDTGKEFTQMYEHLEKLHDEFEDMQIMVKEDVGSNELRDEDIFRINEKIKDLEKQILYVIEG